MLSTRELVKHHCLERDDGLAVFLLRRCSGVRAPPRQPCEVTRLSERCPTKARAARIRGIQTPNKFSATNGSALKRQGSDIEQNLNGQVDTDAGRRWMERLRLGSKDTQNISHSECRVRFAKRTSRRLVTEIVIMSLSFRSVSLSEIIAHPELAMLPVNFIQPPVARDDYEEEGDDSSDEVETDESGLEVEYEDEDYENDDDYNEDSDEDYHDEVFEADD